MVNRYSGSPVTDSSTSTGSMNLLANIGSTYSDLTTIGSRSPTSNSADLEQLLRPMRSNASTTSPTSAAAHQDTGFSAPPPFTELSLDELTSRHEKLNAIAYAPQWRDNAPAAIDELRKLLPPSPPPAYELLAWACDEFAAFTRSGSCADCRAMLDILDALQTLVEDARLQQQRSSPDSPSTSPPQRKKLRLDDSAATPRIDAISKSMPDSTISSIKDCGARLEQIPVGSPDWADRATPIAKELLDVLESDQASCSRFPFLLTLCRTFDTCDKVVGDDLMNALRAVSNRNEEAPISLLSEDSDTQSAGTSASFKRPLLPAAPPLSDDAFQAFGVLAWQFSQAVPKRDVAQTLGSLNELKTLAEDTGQIDIAHAAALQTDWDDAMRLAEALNMRFPIVPISPVFKDANEAAVYGVLRTDSTLTRQQLMAKLPDLDARVLAPAAAAVRSQFSFGLCTDNFLRVSNRVLNASNAGGFARSVAKREQLAVSQDLFDSWQQALIEYQADHEQKLPSSEAEVTDFARYLKMDDASSAIWAAAICRPPYCVPRAQAQVDHARWSSNQPDKAASRTSRIGPNIQVPRTLEEAICRYPYASIAKLRQLAPGITLSYFQRHAANYRDTLAFGLPSLEAIQSVVFKANLEATATTFQTSLSKIGLAMNRLAFPEWKIALAAYKRAHENAIPHSAAELTDFVNYIQPGPAAAALYWAVCGPTNYCQPLHIAIEDWQKREPFKFQTEEILNPLPPTYF
ncbi:hypothetical protein BH10PSE18_BH10PSE18_12100 [soil metagenome]